MALGTWRLGDVEVRRIGFGTKRLTGDRDQVWSCCGAWSSWASANAMLREALAPYPDHLVVATKVGPTADGVARPDQLRDLVVENLRDLGREHLDLVYLRQHGLSSVADRHGAATPAQVRLAWVLALGPHVLAIPGSGREDHLVENLAAADLTLTADDLAALDSVSTSP